MMREERNKKDKTLLSNVKNRDLTLIKIIVYIIRLFEAR
jgi:hypothetical protein